MQSKLAEHKINFVPAHPEVKTDPALAAVLKGAKIFPIDDEYAGANRKRIVERWVKEVLPRSRPWRAAHRRAMGAGSRRSGAARRHRWSLWLLLGAVRRSIRWPSCWRAPSSTTARLHARAAARRGLPTPAIARRSSTACCSPPRSASLGTAARLPVRLHGGARRPRPALADALLDAATLLPLVSPPFTTSIAIIFSFGPQGLHHPRPARPRQRHAPTASGARTLAETLTYFPIAYLTCGRSWPRSIPTSRRWRSASAARAGASSAPSPCRSPCPGFANAFLLLFAASLADFATPLILAGNSFPVLPTQAYLQITGMFDFKGGAVLSLHAAGAGRRGLPAAALLGRPPRPTSP